MRCDLESTLSNEDADGPASDATVTTPDMLDGLKLGEALLRSTLSHPEVQTLAHPLHERYPRYSYPFSDTGGVLGRGE